jgi:2-polyprenyl-3-methyl-5-hydroxy-6-metoxy-1,4-benzoquinol methylase
MKKIKISHGIREESVVVGNFFNKYESKNPIVKWIMNGFTSNLNELVLRVKPKTINEIGCGEGYWVIHWTNKGYQARGSDFSKTAINLAKINAKNHGVDPSLFKISSIYNLSKKDQADLIICCEVMEHLESPEKALHCLQKITSRFIILSVPNEPLWRFLNLLRGKYFLSLGNTPGHIQHWSRKEFVKLISKNFKILSIKSPLPWTMLLCKKK